MAVPQRCAACSTKLLVSFAAAWGARIRSSVSVLPTRQLRVGTGAKLLPVRGFHHTRLRLESTLPGSATVGMEKAAEKTEHPTKTYEEADVRPDSAIANESTPEIAAQLKTKPVADTPGGEKTEDPTKTHEEADVQPDSAIADESTPETTAQLKTGPVADTLGDIPVEVQLNTEPVAHTPGDTPVEAQLEGQVVPEFPISSPAEAKAQLESDTPPLEPTNTPVEAEILTPPVRQPTSPAWKGDPSVPWFLRVETPKAPRHPLAEQQVLPELPEDSPPELSEVLNQLFEDHGIADLKILDLRPLDPPPAIGTTLMILGTARSIRHLHATADKLCRFMRSQYKWTPYADGLLGRYELRLINRRKQRRGKVVSTQLGEVDEAGSAGWVCVNGGNQRLVVQLFVQSKREEMDIEGLWAPILGRAERHRTAEAARRAERERKWAEEDEQAAQVEEQTKEDDLKPVHAQYSTLSTAATSISGPMIHTRSLHNWGSLASDPAVAAEMDVTNHATFPEFLNTGDLSTYLSTLPPPSDDAHYSVIHRAHINALKSPLVKASTLLGIDFDDRASTPFLRTFYQNLPFASPALQVKSELELKILGNIHKQEAYPIRSFQYFLESLRAAGKPVHPEHYYIILSHLAVCPELRSQYSQGWLSHADKRVSMIKNYLNRLSRYLSPSQSAQLFNRPEFRYATFLAFMKEPITPVREAIIAHDSRTELQLPFLPRTFTFHPKVWSGQGYGSLSDPPYTYTLKQHHLDWLTSLGIAGKWSRLWSVWKKIALHDVPRTAEFYKLIYGLVAVAGNQKEAVYCARQVGLEAMAREEPKVSLEMGLARAFKKVVEMADAGEGSAEWKHWMDICDEAERNT
ncbi:hypothetical protein BZA05DRAFT_402577 [Tricharina praecox]|uniref:uncharacterized protein n=1 Tax=Tricharina praecox TaxID=43433 RepID=UPI00221FAD15|nr:uncharacterized protein BZA05DRAFT_402577 [Tricharina praecox]KAI5849208.1 hypothetical protein BZA05DRAFT_402577 [Tricharina praecox]